ncbi:VOC family protein [Mycolicibacter longobardus]|uniref:2,3-dihydroxybiphenyl 1,2-dioxygenase n=1 Tax=Mycolicibacter longobardus TaxID=1108812 RepID=A0A1X1YER2_9MYCO|nr:VOC family protein [Mycolicibacter longobardus]MCV7382999.1 VOC family protein [Mycolicibacter longobardus]ORW09510.1 2,3-dihydroxybiphenyl 1,2-dioxygenase [Mycolicibacter longobardus]
MAEHGTHNDLHTDSGPRGGEHPGRAVNPVVKVRDLAWLEFDKPDLARAEVFARAFGFATVSRTADELILRGTDAGAPAVLIRRGPRSRYLGAAFHAAETADLLRLADATGTRAQALPEHLGGMGVELTDPDGVRVKVVADTHLLPALPAQAPLRHNTGSQTPRTNETQRASREPARVQRLGHVVVQTTTYLQTLDWYLRHLGLIVSDFKFYAGQRDRGPVMSFLRCDRGSTPADHHTLAMTLGPRNRYVHSAYQVSDFDALAAGGEHLLGQGYFRSWGIGRHIEGSQIFDYWRDPDGFLVEHFTDGDVFDNTVQTGWSAMTASGLAQWGPPASLDFMGVSPRRMDAFRELASIATALGKDNEFDLTRLRGLLAVARS